MTGCADRPHHAFSKARVGRWQSPPTPLAGVAPCSQSFAEFSVLSAFVVQDLRLPKIFLGKLVLHLQK